MIIVEGPDGAGKSTLIERIHEAYPRQRFLTGGSRGPDEFVSELISSSFAREIENVPSDYRVPYIYDRLMFSEVVYGKVLRGEVLFSPNQFYFWTQLMGLLKVPMILCLPSYKDVEKNVTEGNHMAGVSDHINRIYHAYEILARSLEKATPTKGVISRAQWAYGYSMDAEISRRFTTYDYNSPSDFVVVRELIEEYIDHDRPRRIGWPSSSSKTAA